MWTRPASMASASSTMWRVPSTLATRHDSASASRVVDRREVEQVVDVALEHLHVLVGEAEARLGEVPDDSDDPVLAHAPAGGSSSRRPFDPSRTST